MEEERPRYDEQTLKYVTGTANVIRADCLISRERLNSKMDYVYVDDYNNGLRYYSGPQRRKPFKLKPTGEIEEDTESLVEEIKVKEKPKPKDKNNNGGKFTYTKVFVSKMKAIPREKLTLELMGVCLCLASCIEWETGFLIVGRGKNRRRMTKEDIAKELEKSVSTVRRFIAKLSEMNILEESKDGYRMNTEFLAKGRACDASKVRKGVGAGTDSGAPG